MPQQPHKANPALPADLRKHPAKCHFHVYVLPNEVSQGKYLQKQDICQLPNYTGNTEGQHQAGKHCTDLCAGSEGCCQAVSLQLQVEE